LRTIIDKEVVVMGSCGSKIDLQEFSIIYSKRKYSNDTTNINEINNFKKNDLFINDSKNKKFFRIVRERNKSICHEIRTNTMKYENVYYFYSRNYFVLNVVKEKLTENYEYNNINNSPHYIRNVNTLFYTIRKEYNINITRESEYNMIITNRCYEGFPLRMIIIFNKNCGFYPSFLETTLLYGESIYINNNYNVENVIIILLWEYIILKYSSAIIYNVYTLYIKNKIIYNNVFNNDMSLLDKNIKNELITSKIRDFHFYCSISNVFDKNTCTQIPRFVRYKNFMSARINYCFNGISHKNSNILDLFNKEKIVYEI